MPFTREWSPADYSQQILSNPDWRYRLGPRNHLPSSSAPVNLETLEQAHMLVERIAEACAPNGTCFIFKEGYDKTNPSSLNCTRGQEMVQGLEILNRVRKEYRVPVLTDVHEQSQCAQVAEVSDVLQIPAFFCRRTDLLLAAGETRRASNAKTDSSQLRGLLQTWPRRSVRPGAVRSCYASVEPALARTN